MFERMNAHIAGQGKAADKVTPMIPNSNAGHASNTTNRKKKECANCRKLIFHRMEIVQEQQCAGLTGTGDIE